MNNNDLIDVVLMAKHAGGKQWEGMGTTKFRVMPRMGENVVLDIDGVGHIYKVVAVHHPDQPATCAADIYIVHIGDLLEELKRLRTDN